VVNLRFNSLIKVSEMEDIDIIDTCEHKTLVLVHDILFGS
jgi:hypothetical protein